MTNTSEPEEISFNRAARDFDRLGQHLWYPIGQATVERTNPQPGDRVLDACCGNGASALPAAERVGATGMVDAIDLSTDLVEQLRERGQSQIHAQVADATEWHTRDYDVVQCVLGIFFFPDMEAGTRHLMSRARSGGRVGFTIWKRGAVEEAGRHLARAVEQVTGREHSERPEHLIDQINEADAFRDWLGKLGLDHVQVTESQLTVRLDPEVAWLVITGSGFVSALNGLSNSEIENVRHEYLKSLTAAGIDELDATTLIGTGHLPG